MQRLMKMGCTLALCAAAWIVPAAASAQAARPLKKVSIALGGVTVINVTYPWLMMPIALDYWKSEGYDVNVIAAPGSVQAVQQLATGNVDFAQVSSNVAIQANVASNIPARVVMDNSVIDWAVAVQADGPMRTVADFKGKNIGIVSLASGGLPLLRSLLKANGLDPDKDVNIIPTGAGAPALEALRSNRVQGLMFWNAAIAGFENAGAKLRLFRSPEWQRLPDFSLTVLQRTAERDPAMVEAIVRGAAKASLFAVSNPECVRKLHWARFPDSKPTGSDDATLARWDDNLLRAQIESMKAAFEMNGGKLWGRATPEAFGRMQDFMLDARMIERKVAPATFIVANEGFFERVNNFDAEAVVKQAKACAPR
ncbi:ABC transporter substrate-binding protein [Variovorax sp. PBL-E5]|uniref:ABC transporter substrate-binding protein n=1 Tax=Variovorax sp. PBL-E5 TaxID=434014 RepID=UPI001319A782|nr:ABC transporter substrate-binding protein [Variovorax sp. PBL-E5]VTU45628.1 ABC transporter, substrate-binding protein, aliphatic sulfonates family [Variovorax sp. PBL-E5]